MACIEQGIEQVGVIGAKRGCQINAHLAVGRAIVLEVALAAQHQLDVAHATHAARLFAVDLADASLVDDSAGMVHAKLVLINAARPLEVGLCLGVLASEAQQIGQIAQCRRQYGMMGTQGRLLNGQGAFKHGLGRIELPLTFQHRRQIVQGNGHLGMVGGI